MATNFGHFLKKSVPFLYLGGGAVAGFAILYPNTVGLEHYKHLVAIHTPDGKEEKVDVELIRLAEEIKRDYKWPTVGLESTESTTIFATPSFEFNRLGTAKSKWGCHIGIPKYYFQKYRQDKTQMDETLKLLEIDPVSEAANDIKQSFNISHAAKKFALAREMKLSKNYQIYFFAFGAQVAVSCLYLVPNIVSSVLPFPGIRLLAFVSLFPLYYTGFLKALKKSDRRIHNNADEAAASLSNEVAYGGLEYYDALLLREKWLGNEHSENIDGKRLFQELFQKPWNFSFLTLHERKEYLKQFIETNTKKQDSDNE